MMLSTIAFVLICAACAVQAVFILMRKSEKDFVSGYIILAASALLFATIVIRSIRIQFVAVTNMYESLTLFAAVLLLVVFFYGLLFRRYFYPLLALASTFVALCFLALASSPLVPKDVLPPVPALRSAWLVLHVVCAFVGESFFAVSFIAACAYFFVKDRDKKLRVERIVYTTIGIGYPIFTIGALIFGAIWAQVAWGSFWSWDYKEVWALITCLVYTGYLHVRLILKNKRTLSAVIAAVGFLFTLFTLFGVNYLLPGLHSYM
jgi:ABC-type transport system involved in cytochrome c biogenesis permease subunit